MTAPALVRAFRPVDAAPGSAEELGTDYLAVRELLRRINITEEATPGFGWGRWEWAFSVPYLDRTALGHNQLWEHEGRLVAAVVHEGRVTDRYLMLDPTCADLTGEVVAGAAESLRGLTGGRLLIDDRQRAAQTAALDSGLVATPDGEHTGVIDVGALPDARPPAGYGYRSNEEGLDVLAYDRVLHRGFGQPGLPAASPEVLRWRRRELSAPSAVGRLQVAVTAPDGSYAAFCGAWHVSGEDYALIEPVATDPDHRRLGCGTAAVVEALRRCAARGAARAYIGSNQPFYYAMGLMPRFSGSWWVPREAVGNPPGSA